MSILPHFYNYTQINQVRKDTELAGRLIPKGYCNATEMCKANGKRWNDYAKLKSSKAYWDELSLDTRIIVSRLIIEIKGTPNGDASLQGTWVHPEIAIDLSQWVSPKFRVWANRTLRLVINDEFEAQTENAEKAQARLEELEDSLWEKARIIGKCTRRTLTDSVKDWYECNPNGSSRPIGVMIAQTTNLVYQFLWGMDALHLEAYLGCGRNESRDYLSEPDLKRLDRAEARVTEFIDEDNIKPVEAVKLADIRKAKNLPQSK